MQESNRKSTKLGPDALTEVENFRNGIFYRWPNPPVPAEGKLDWDDDLAVLYVDFGFSVLDSALTWHRQNTVRRPAIPEIREQCKQIRERAGVRRTKGDIDFARHEADVRRHLADPNDSTMLPVALVMRDFSEYRRLMAASRASGRMPTADELQAWWDYRDAETVREWLALKAKGVVGLKMRETGSARDPIGQREGLSAVGEIVSSDSQMRLDTATQPA